MEIKELINKLKGGIVNGWKRLGSEDVEQEVEVTYPADTIADLNKLGGIVNYKSNLDLERKASKVRLNSQSYPSRYENEGKIIHKKEEISKEGKDKGDIVR